MRSALTACLCRQRENDQHPARNACGPKVMAVIHALIVPKTEKGPGWGEPLPSPSGGQCEVADKILPDHRISSGFPENLQIGHPEAGIHPDPARSTERPMRASSDLTSLCRTVRFTVNPWKAPPDRYCQDVHNGFAGWPAMQFPGAYFELDVVCCGQPDPESGYVMDIRSIDRAARETAIAAIRDAFGRLASTTTEALLGVILDAMSRSLGPALHSVR